MNAKKLIGAQVSFVLSFADHDKSSHDQFRSLRATQPLCNESSVSRERRTQREQAAAALRAQQTRNQEVRPVFLAFFLASLFLFGDRRIRNCRQLFDEQEMCEQRLREIDAHLQQNQADHDRTKQVCVAMISRQCLWLRDALSCGCSCNKTEMRC